MRSIQSHFRNLMCETEESQTDVKFTIANQKLDDMFNSAFKDKIDHEGENYSLSREDFEDFKDFVQSNDGFDMEEDVNVISGVEEMSVTGGGEAYLPGLDVPAKKYKYGYTQDVNEDVNSGYKDVKGFRPGHTKDKGGFQYKDLWNVNEREETEKFGFKVGDNVEIVGMWPDTGYGEIVSFDDEMVKVNVNKGGGSTFVRQMDIPPSKLQLQKSEIEKKEKKEKKKEKEAMKNEPIKEMDDDDIYNYYEPEEQDDDEDKYDWFTDKYEDDDEPVSDYGKHRKDPDYYEKDYKEKGKSDYFQRRGLDEVNNSTTNSEELARVEELLAAASRDNNYSVMSAYENRIKRLKLLVWAENKLDKQLPLLKFSTDFADYLRNELGYEGPVKYSQLGGLKNKEEIAKFIINSQNQVKEISANDPVLMAMRAKKDAPKPQVKKSNPNQAKINMLLKKKAEIERDMEQEAEPEGGKIADEYGEKLNKIDKAIAKLKEGLGFESGKEFINIKLQRYPKALAKVNNLISMIGENNFTMDMAEWIWDFFNNASFESPISEETLLENYSKLKNARSHKRGLDEGIKTEIRVRNKAQQFKEATKLANKKLKEVHSILEYASQIRPNLNEGEYGASSKMMEVMKRNLAEAYKKMKEL